MTRLRGRRRVVSVWTAAIIGVVAGPAGAARFGRAEAGEVEPVGTDRNSVPAPAAYKIGDSDPATESAGPTRAGSFWQRRQAPVPRLKLGYRRFSFVRVGAADPTSPTGAAAPETFESLSLDVYPLSNVVRAGLSSQFGWESGEADRSGDYFIAQSFSLGVQRTGRVTPFFEVLAGGGYMRRRQFGTTIPTAYWQLGADAGAEIYVRGRAYVSVAVGYLRPVNGFLRQLDFTSVYADTWSMKLGVGL